MRQHPKGATRSNDEGKIDYAHISALADRVWCEYMHEHRIQEDGKLREPDNYKKGMPLKWNIKSFRGHFKDFELLLEGHKVTENGKEKDLFESILGMEFNLKGMIISTMTGAVIDRKYTNGKLKDDFNRRFKKLL